MRFLLFLIALASSWVANSERTFPADVQFSLLFPCNETYTPTQLFPIVFAVSNLDAVWPLQFYLSMRVLADSFDFLAHNPPYWKLDDFGHGSEFLVEAARHAPGKHFFYFPLVNMTNGTTESFSIAWTVALQHRCFANETKPSARIGEDSSYWSNSPGESMGRILEFSTNSGGQRPDIENIVNSCPVSDEDNTAAIRITNMRKDKDTGENCTVFDTDIPFDNCAFKPSAKELAANVPAAMLKEMRCEHGEWQTITAPCPKKTSMGSLQSSSFGAGWVLLVSMFFVFSIL